MREQDLGSLFYTNHLKFLPVNLKRYKFSLKLKTIVGRSLPAFHVLLYNQQPRPLTMNLGRRLTLSFALIFLLFAANLAINWWGSSERAKALYQLRNAVDRQLLANKIDQVFELRKKENSIYHKLRVQIGARALNEEETAKIVAKLNNISSLAENLHQRTDLENTADIDSFIALFDTIQTEWLRIYTSKNKADYQSAIRFDIVKKATLTIQALKNSEQQTVLKPLKMMKKKRLWYSV